MRVLVVEDEVRQAAALKRGLEAEGFAVDVAGNGNDGLWLAVEQAYDAIVLDVMLPGMNGYKVCAQLREKQIWTPVLMLTARDAVSDRVAGLDAGADDYVVKPFALVELLARLRALLRRSGAGAAGQTLHFADLELDPVSHQVKRGDRLVELTRTEFSLLELFLLHPRQVLTRPVIFDRVWGYDFGPGSNSLEVYVSYLRRKTEAEGEPRLLHTVRGVGYVLREE